MISDPQGTVLALFAVFCRIGGCFMILPGFSSSRVPMNFRLLVAVAVSLALTPILWDTVYAKVQGSEVLYLSIIFVEGLVGVVLGLIPRFFILGLQFVGTVITMMIGFSAPPSSDILEDSPENDLTNMITITALLMLFILDFHHMIIGALADSYVSLPIGELFDARRALVTLTDTASQTFLIMLRLASPFIVYGFIFNIAIGFINKLAPQLPIYFISTPFIIMGGLLLFYFGIAGLVSLFADAFQPLFSGV